MKDEEALNRAFSELDYEDEAFNELDKQLQKKVATGVTDGTVDPYKIISDLTEALRSQPSREDVIEEVALEIEKFTFAFGVDTVNSFAAFVRGMK